MGTPEQLVCKDSVNSRTVLFLEEKIQLLLQLYFFSPVFFR